MLTYSYVSEQKFEKIKKIQESLHKIPEPSWQEEKTKELIRDLVPKDETIRKVFDERAGILYQLQKGSGEGPRYLIRADLDALPIQEESGLSYSSKNSGYAHVCGHDAHMAMLLGLIDILKDLDIDGTVFFLFQAAEEIPPSGAKNIVDRALLDNILPLDGILSAHVVSYLKTGQIGLLPAGHASAGNGFFDIEIKGKSSHSAEPHCAIDPINLAAEIILASNEIIARRIDPRQFAVLSICEIKAGSVKNQIPASCHLGGSLRFVQEKTKNKIIKALNLYFASMELQSGATIDFKYTEGHPPIINDPVLFSKMQKAAKQVVGQDNVVYPAYWSAADDFAHFGRLAPLYYFHLGSAANEDMQKYNNHHPKFELDQEALRLGTELWLEFILQELKQN